MKITDIDSGNVYEVTQTARPNTILEIMRKNRIFLNAPCNGRGSCGKCRIRFVEGAADPTARERRILTPEECESGVRLACEAVPKEDCVISFVACEEKIQAVANVGGNASESSCRSRRDMSAAGQSGDLGLAIDIGTTTIAACLVDMESGETLSVQTETNHQRSFGADVITRIEAANSGAADKLRDSIRNDLRALAERLIDDAGSGGRIVKAVIAGNTTMCHLLLGESCEGLGSAPFDPGDISLKRIDYNGSEAVIMPGISAFVGADIVSGIYASGMADAEESAILLDIGTNGEMVIGDKGGFIATATAAGPVFEGGNISGGTAGIPGAISHVNISCNKTGGYDISYETIANRPAIGICGSAVIDIVSCAVRERLCDETGLLADPYFETGIRLTEEIALTQGDIRQVQMAKGAIRAGIETLISEYEKQGIDFNGKFYIAGGFGYFMDIESAVGIGMLPQALADRTVCLGNSSLSGARKFLLEDADSKDAERTLNRIVSDTRELNLAMQPGFNDRYLECMDF